jgi:undecaprenyl-diphosphatase
MTNDMSLLEAVVLGVVQGASEFLPISSTAHLRVVPALLNWQDPGAAFSAVIQLGSVLAVLTYFRKDIVSISLGAFKALKAKDMENQDFRLAGAIAVGTLPVCVLGLLLKHLIEGSLRSLMVVGIASIVMGLLLLAAERFAKHKRDISTIRGLDGLLVGFGQAMALIPGCSRSGSTLTVSMFLGLKREDAARFSFLLGIPALVLSGLVELKDMLKEGLSSAGTLDLVVSLVVSTAVSYAAIAWFLKYLRNHSTLVFVGYRLIFGITVVVLAAKSIIH